MQPLQRLLYSPFLVQLVVTRRCNLACGYCNEFDDHSDPVPRETLERRLDQIKALGTLCLEFTGGEPMLHPDIYDLIRYARKIGFFKVMMISNAYLLSEERVKMLSDAGLMELQVSLDGAKPNDVTVKVLKPLKPKLEALRKAARFKVVLSAVLGAAPSGEVLEVIEYAKASGFRPRVLLLHDGGGNLHLTPEQLEEFNAVKAALKSHRFGEAHDYRTRLLDTGAAPFKCRAGSRYLYIDEFGDVHWCSQTRDAFSVPLEQYGLRQLKEQFDTVKGCAPQCTVGCVRTQSAYDEWRPQRREHPSSEKTRLPVLG